MNRLANSTSPYLLQHKDNPVDWWPWCDEAFAEARRLDRPVLLSVGYAACHWCHVMAHECFEDAEIAACMNAGFVCIKVDREERPDVDAVYMEALQALSGQGGWPMTVFTTPAGEPFYAGTYFPPRDRGGLPGLPKVLAAVQASWSDRRAELQAVARQVVDRLSRASDATAAEGELDAAVLDAAADRLLAEHDPRWGGFGGAPKFPPALCLEFLLRHATRRPDAGFMDVVTRTCEAMARGGIYDQLAGGFARYSVDARWVVPHFEKMLYDNALLLRLYTRHWRATADPLSRRIATETADFLCDGMCGRDGGFFSSFDADSDGGEGAFYVWTPQQLAAALGERDGSWAAQLFGVAPGGNFEHGSSVLTLAQDPLEGERFADVRTRLLASRANRESPPRDEKVVTAWNGLALGALAEAGALFGRQDLLARARQAARLLLEVHLAGGRLVRASRDGQPGIARAVLEDYADLAEGLLGLHQADGASEWLERAGELLETACRDFGDGHGGFYDTAADAEALIRRPRDPTDNVTPSGTSACAGALLSYSALSGATWAREAAIAALSRLRQLVQAAPRFAGWAAALGEAVLAGPLEIAVVGRADLAQIARLATSPGAVTVATGTQAPLLRERPPGAAYVCRGFVCQAPIRDGAQLAAAVGARWPDAGPARD